MRLTYRCLMEYVQNGLFERRCLDVQRIVVRAWINDEVVKLEIEGVREQRTAMYEINVLEQRIVDTVLSIDSNEHRVSDSMPWHRQSTMEDSQRLLERYICTYDGQTCLRRKASVSLSIKTDSYIAHQPNWSR